MSKKKKKKKREKIKVQSVYMPIYNVDIELMQSKTLKPIIKKYRLDENSHNADAVTFTKLNGTHVIAITKRINQGLIAHECLHVVTRVFHDIGMPINMNCDEAACHLLQWLVGAIDYYFDPLKIKKKK